MAFLVSPLGYRHPRPHHAPKHVLKTFLQKHRCCPHSLTVARIASPREPEGNW